MALIAATGFFDGVHKGHRMVIETLCSEAAKLGAESLVVTFWPHPRTVLQNGARELRLLNSLEEKKEKLLSLGVDRVEVLDFTREFATMTSAEYLRCLKERFGVTGVLLGYDNTIGSDLLSPLEAAQVARETGLDVVMAPGVKSGDATISSTRIRRSLSDGDVRSAAAMLGYSYSLRGVVVAGNRLGRTIGFPTANLRLYDPLKQIPGNGVYLTKVHLQGREYWGMTNIGVKPTVSSGREVTIETNIFGYDDECYGLDISLEFADRIREERKFPSLNELAIQLEKDKQQCLSHEVFS